MSQLDSAGGPSATMELRECARARTHIVYHLQLYMSVAVGWRRMSGGWFFYYSYRDLLPVLSVRAARKMRPGASTH